MGKCQFSPFQRQPAVLAAEPWKTTVPAHDLCVISWLRWLYHVDTR